MGSDRIFFPKKCQFLGQFSFQKWQRNEVADCSVDRLCLLKNGFTLRLALYTKNTNSLKRKRPGPRLIASVDGVHARHLICS